MQKVIDTPMDISAFTSELRREGVETVIRYYNHRNSTRLPSKRIERAEADALADAGFSIATVFQQRGGSNGHIEDLDRESGQSDARRALQLADALDQPDGSAIYFAVDHDYFRQSELDRIAPYFEAVREALDSRFRVGCYGSGTVGKRMRDLGHADLIWLAGATGWSGTRAMLETDEWALFQKELDRTWPGGAFGYDGNIVNPAFADFGQFTPGGAALTDPPTPELAVLMEITARSGLRLRRGPGTDFASVDTLPVGTIVTVLGQSGEWMQVDLESDGLADGFMHGSFLRTVSGGFSVAPVAIGTPFDIAQAELALDIREVEGPDNNPRIVLYHASTSTGAEPDEVPWCSSFVNYCVEQAGFSGTDSKWAMSWHDESWGADVTDTPEAGDIAVFRRRQGSARGAVKGGHVGFWMDDTGNGIVLLGGNQSNRVRISTYPKRGKLPGGDNHYELLSIRRP